MKDIKYEVYMGINRRGSSSFDIAYVKETILKAFDKYQINFSLNTQLGGYVYQDGNYIIEDGFKMTFIGKRNKEEEQLFFNELKKIFNQESILVIKREVDATFKKE